LHGCVGGHAGRCLDFGEAIYFLVSQGMPPLPPLLLSIWNHRISAKSTASYAAQRTYISAAWSRLNTALPSFFVLIMFVLIIIALIIIG
jgi:hypothetical protein